MRKFSSKKSIILYGCSGLGINMLNMIVGSYLCSALLVGGFVDHVEHWTYLNKDLVVAGLWSVFILVAKLIDGLIDLPLSHFVDNLKSKFGKRKTGILLGYFPTILSYVLFLIPIDSEASVLNTVWFGFLLVVFYSSYTLTMITYYATFAEVTKDQEEIVLLSNVKSICDVVYFSLSFALVPLFVNLGMNIRLVALSFLPLTLTMLIPLCTLKEDSEEKTEVKAERTTFFQSLRFTLQDRPFIQWLGVLFVMNMGLQLFLSGINEYFSTTGLNMTFVMASCFVPVPFTIFIYNKVVNKWGLAIGLRYVLVVYSVGMALMGFCNLVPHQLLTAYAIGCSLIVSFAIGTFFSVIYTVPSQCAAYRVDGGETASSMYFAVQGLFEGASAGLASGALLVYMKQNDLISWLTVVVAGLCMIAFVFSFFLPKSILKIGKQEVLSK